MTSFEFYMACRDKYKVSKDGKVFSRNFYKRKREIELKQTLDSYPCVCLCLNGKAVKFNVHSLVMFEYVGAPPEGMQVCHRNDIRTDNRLENLYYGTAKENKNDAKRNKKIPIGERHPNAKFSNLDIREMKRDKSLGMKLKDIAVKFKTSRTYVCSLLKTTHRAEEIESEGI